MSLLIVDDEEEEDQVDPTAEYDKTIIPEYVISLEASDEFLKDRVMNLPEQEVSGTHNSEEGFRARLSLFRSWNTEDETVLNYFDELEIHPEIISKILACQFSHYTDTKIIASQCKLTEFYDL
jgi:adenylate kinase